MRNGNKQNGDKGREETGEMAMNKTYTDKKWINGCGIATNKTKTGNKDRRAEGSIDTPSA